MVLLNFLKGLSEIGVCDVISIERSRYSTTESSSH